MECKYCGKKYTNKYSLKYHYFHEKNCYQCYLNDKNEKNIFHETNNDNLTCKYCGKSGIKNKKGLASHRKFSKSCYDQWKKEQDQIDSNKTKVVCCICGKKLRNISNTHLKLHGLTQQEYKKKYPEAKIFSEGLLEIQKQKREKRIFEKYGDDKSYLKQNLQQFQKRYGKEDGIKRYNEFCGKIGCSLKKCIKKYGEEDGIKRYNEWKVLLNGRFSKQWFLKKYGSLGEEKYNEHVNKLKYCHSVEWYIENYGEENGLVIWNKINNKKIHTLENFINKYGEIDGAKRYNEMKEKIGCNIDQSNIAIEFFNEIKSYFNDRKMYFHKNPKEFGKYLKSIKKYCFLDFYMPEENKAIEFYGDYWHCNPKIYSDYELVLFPYNKSIVAKDVRDKDNERIEAIKKEIGCDILIVWENDYINNKEETINKAINFIKQSR